MFFRMHFSNKLLNIAIKTSFRVKVIDGLMLTRLLLALVSFLIYGISVLSLHQDKTQPTYVEGAPIGAALSHILLGSPLGTEDSGFARYLASQTDNPTAAIFVKRAVHAASTVQSHEYIVTGDGGGVGPILAWTLAFWLFGLSAHSIIYLYLLIIFISSITFLARYCDKRVVAVPVLSLSLTLLLLTPLSTAAEAGQALIGGTRYYAVVGILPALHWFFEFFDTEASLKPRTATRCRLLAIQVAILGLAILVRRARIPPYPSCGGSDHWLVAETRIVLRTHRTLTLFIPTVGLLVGLTALPRLAFPEAAASGRLYGVVWHRAFIGFGVNPAWPFAGMRDKYDCAPQVPEGLRPWVVDLNGICVWFSYGPNGARTVEAIGGELYDSHYEVALRHAFFDVIQSHPRDAFETLLIFKPKLIIKVLSSALYPRLSDIGHKILPLIILQMLVFTVYIAARPTVAPFNTAAHQFCILFLFMTAALIPQILTFTAAHTAIDLLTYTIGGWVILFALLVSCASSLWRRRPLIGSRF